MTSSSPRAASEFEAVLVFNENVVGPIMLPEKDHHAFVAEFNATYGRIGLTIESLSDLHVPRRALPAGA